MARKRVLQSATGATVVLAGLIGLVGLVTGAPADKSIQISALDYRFDPDEMTADAGEVLTVTLLNRGAFVHNIVFELDAGREEGVQTLPPGGQGEVTFSAPITAGQYVYFCSIGNHRELGMEGTLSVQAAEGPAITTLARNLRNPHGLGLHRNGDALLVAEGGTANPVGGQFGPGNGDGRVTGLLVSDPSLRQVLADNLANAFDPGGGVVGANHAVWLDPLGDPGGDLLITLSGGPGHPDPKAQLLAGPVGGPYRVFADLWEFEEQNNPDGVEPPEGIDSNPWKIVHGADDLIYVTDAGGNDVLKVDPESAAVELYAVMDPVGMRPDGSPIQAVPTGLAFGPGNPKVMFVSLLGSFGPGNGQLRRLEDINLDGDAMDAGENVMVLDGLTMAVDVAFSPSGRLYVLEFGGMAPEGFRPGMSRVSLVGGPTRVAVEGFFGATSMVFLRNGDLLVTGAQRYMGLNSDRVLRIPADALRVPGEPTPTQEPEVTATPTGEPETGWDIFLPLGAKDWWQR